MENQRLATWRMKVNGLSTTTFFVFSVEELKKTSSTPGNKWLHFITLIVLLFS